MCTCCVESTCGYTDFCHCNHSKLRKRYPSVGYKTVVVEPNRSRNQQTNDGIPDKGYVSTFPDALRDKITEGEYNGAMKRINAACARQPDKCDAICTCIWCIPTGCLTCCWLRCAMAGLNARLRDTLVSINESDAFVGKISFTLGAPRHDPPAPIGVKLDRRTKQERLETYYPLVILILTEPDAAVPRMAAMERD